MTNLSVISNIKWNHNFLSNTVYHLYVRSIVLESMNDNHINSALPTGWGVLGESNASHILHRQNICSEFNFSLFYTAQYHKLQICLRGLYNLYTYDIAFPGPHIDEEVPDFLFHYRWKRRSPDGVCWEGIPLACVLDIQNGDFHTKPWGAAARPAGQNHCEWRCVDASLMFVCTSSQNLCIVQLQVKDRRFEWTRDKMLVLREVTHSDQGLYAIKLFSGFTYEAVRLTVSGTRVPSFSGIQPCVFITTHHQ